MSSISVPITTERPVSFPWLRRITSNFLLRRLLKALFTIWIVTTLIFFVIRAMPGSPVDIFVNDLVLKGLTEEEAVRRAAALLRINLNEPLPQQYLEFLSNLAHGDLGISYINRGQEVSALIAQRLPWTLFSVGTSLILSFFLGMLLGMIIAYKRESWLDHLLTNIAAGLDAIPAYMTAIVLIILISLVWKIVPAGELRGSLSAGIKPGFTIDFFTDVLKHLALPALVYILASVGSWMLTMKSSTVSTLGEDYVTVAKARGLPESRIITAYVGRNASLPLFTRFALSIAFILGGSVIIEKIFTYQGIGLLLSQALYSRDYPVMQGIVLLITGAVVIGNLVADLLYSRLDPRIARQGSA
jgi:peptide/nickel transport system permease protein